MKGAKMKGWALIGAMALVGTMASSAIAIESFQERFEWGDLSKPTTLRGRVAVTDPYDKAVWINVAVFGGNAESGYYWQKYFPGKNLKMYAADDKVMATLTAAGKSSHSQAVMGVPTGEFGQWVSGLTSRCARMSARHFFFSGEKI